MIVSLLQLMGLSKREPVHSRAEEGPADKPARAISRGAVSHEHAQASPARRQEVKSKPEFHGRTLGQLNEIDKYHLNVVTIIRKREKTNLIGKKTIVKETIGIVTPNTILFENDILVVFGENKDILNYCAGGY